MIVASFRRSMEPRNLGLLQPAAALVQAACCLTGDCCQTAESEAAKVRNGCPQQAVGSKAAAGCRTPKGSHTRGFAAPPMASSC